MNTCLIRSSALVFSLFAASAQGGGLYYELEVIAEQGSSTTDGDTIQAFHRSSINESGIVAFTADAQKAGPTLRRVHISGEPGTPIPLGTQGDSRTTGFAQINAAGKIVAWEGFLTGTPRHTLIRVWDALNPAGTPTYLTSTQTNGLDSVLSPPSISNDGTVLFSALAPRRIYLNTNGVRDARTDVGSIIPNGQPMVSSGGRYVLREGQLTAGNVSLNIPGQARRTLASAGMAAAWYQIGNLPGISDSGKVVAFAGDHYEQGEGIYLWIDEPGDENFAEPVKILGFGGGRDGLGFSNNESPVEFDTFDMVNRVAVAHREAGPPGIEGDSILISFIATPTDDSFHNPRTGFPMLYTRDPALWVVHLTPSRGLTGQGPIRLDNKTSPMPVVQVGQTVKGRKITAISTYDPLAFAEKTPAGFERVTIGPADHYLACDVMTSDGVAMVLRASQFDSDFDGLFDHWERVGGGVDIDRDGEIDMVLADYGADPYRKDMFIEIDWLSEWRPEPYTDLNGNGRHDEGEPYDDLDQNGSYSITRSNPDPAALQKIVDQFEKAPVPNPVGPPGITVHIDAGAASSINLPPTAVPSGGSLVRTAVTGEFVHLIYADPEVYQFRNPATPDLAGKPVNEVGSQSLRDRYSGFPERGARELVFRHVIFGYTVGAVEAKDAVGVSETQLFARRVMREEEPYEDLDGDGTWSSGDPFVDLNGNGVWDEGEPFDDVTGGDGYDPPEPFTDLNGNGVWDDEELESYRSMPGNSIILGLQGIDASMTKDGLLPVIFPNPGVAEAIPAPPGFFHYQVLYHEIGHTLGLLHGGSDFSTANGRATPKPEYRSIMNYGYTDLPDSDGVLVDDYSSNPATFDDWSNVRLDFSRYFDCLGGHRFGARFSTGAGHGDGEDHKHGHQRRTIEWLERQAGPLGPVDRVILGYGTNVSEDETDRDGDGLVLLLEVALGMNPDVSDLDAYPIISGYEPGDGGGTLFMIYPRNTALGIRYEVEQSIDLKGWSSDGVEEFVISTEGAVQQVRASLSVEDPGKHFFRLKVSRE